LKGGRGPSQKKGGESRETQGGLEPEKNPWGEWTPSVANPPNVSRKDKRQNINYNLRRRRKGVQASPEKGTGAKKVLRGTLGGFHHMVG